MKLYRSSEYIDKENPTPDQRYRTEVLTNRMIQKDWPEFSLSCRQGNRCPTTITQLGNH
jgi:hypothetical protein